MRKFQKNPSLSFGSSVASLPARLRRVETVLGLLFCSLVLLAFVSSFIATPYPPDQMHLEHRFASPSAQHWFGNDRFGRDVFSRVLSASRMTVTISFSAVGIGLVFGALLGLLSGYKKGLLDFLLMQLSDTIMAFPGILLAMVFVAITRPGPVAVTIALGIVFAPSFARLFRSTVAQYKEREFIMLAQIMGVRLPRLIFVHLLPCLMPHLIPAVVIGIANAAIAEAGMSYLGLGIQPPAASWGKMLAEAQSDIFIAPWTIVFPSLFLIVYVLGLYFLGEMLRLRLDQKEGRKHV